MSDSAKSGPSPDPEWRKSMKRRLQKSDESDSVGNASNCVNDFRLLQLARDEIPKTFYSKYLKAQWLNDLPKNC